jgi:hypothetical protein
MLVFRDTILGLVAGVQLTANDMVRRGVSGSQWRGCPISLASGNFRGMMRACLLKT